MFLNELKIKKFRGVENQDFTFTKHLVGLGGKNALGKSTIIDSIMWVLCDETNVYGKENSLNIDKNNPKEPLEVTCVFTKESGEKLELKRIYKASYTKDGEFSKFSNEFFINDAKYSSTEYFKRLNQEIGLEEETLKGFNTLRCLMDFNYLGSIDYKIARTKIEKILGLSNDKELVSKEEYALIKDDLMAQLYDVAKVKTMINKRKSMLEDDIANNEAILNELKNNIKPVDESEISKLEEKLEIVKNKDFQYSAEYLAAKEKIENASKKVNDIAIELNNEEKKLNIAKAQNQNVKENLEVKEQQFEENKKKFLQLKGSLAKCPKCGFALNGEEIKAKLNEIKNATEPLKQEIDELKKIVEESGLNETQKHYDEIWAKYRNATIERDGLQKSLNSIIIAGESEKNQFNNTKIQYIEKYMREISELKSKSDTSLISNKELTIQDLKQQLSKCEIKLVLLEDFKQEKINKIQQKTNEVFPNIEFVLLETSNTGAITETCKATYKGIDYRGLNDGQKIKLGIEIIEDLRKALGVKETLPIVFDKLKDLDSENIKSLVANTQAQIFSTFVSNEDTIKLLEL